MSANSTKEFLSSPIRELHLPTLTNALIRGLDIRTVGQLTELTAEQLLLTPGIQEGSVDQIRRGLGKFDLALEGEEPFKRDSTRRGEKLLHDMGRIPIVELPLSDEMRYLLEANGIQNPAEALIGYAHELANRVEFVSSNMGILVPIMIGEQMHRFQVRRPQPRTTMTLQEMLDTADALGLCWPHPDALEALQQSRLPGLKDGRIKGLLAVRGNELRVLDTTVPGGEIKSDDAQRVFDGRDWFLFEETS